MKTFRNEEPFGFWQAVCLLHSPWGSRTSRSLNTFPRDKPTIDVEHYTGAYDSLSAIDRFQITRQAADELKDRRLVIGAPAWGYRSSFKFVTTDALEEEYCQTIAPRFSAWPRCG